MSKILKNQTASPITITDVGSVIVPASPAIYTIPPMDYLLWAQSSDIITYLNDLPTPSIIVSDSFNDLNPSDGMDLLKFINTSRAYTAPIIDSETIAASNVEQTFSPRANIRKMILYNSGRYIVNYGYATGGPYLPLTPYSARVISNSGESALDIFLKSAGSGFDVIIESWL